MARGPYIVSEYETVHHKKNLKPNSIQTPEKTGEQSMDVQAQIWTPTVFPSEDNRQRRENKQYEGRTDSPEQGS